MWWRFLSSLILLLGLSGASWGKLPAVIPPHHFALKIPQDWLSPARDQWCAPDGNISLVWNEISVKTSPPLWAAEAQKKFPGSLLNKDLKLQLGGQPAWCFVGSYSGRIQRVYLTCRQGHGVILVCSCSPSQNFATVGIVQDILNSFRWLPDQG